MGHTEAADALLSGSLLIMGFRKPSAYHVQLTSCAIKYSPLDNGIKSKDIPLNDVFGVDCMKGKLITDPIAYLTLYVYKRGKTLTGNVDFIRQRSVVVFMVADSPLFAENLHVAQMWKSMILKFSRPQGPRNHYSGTWLVLINPAGGQGKAVALFKERVVPIFAEAAIPFEVIVSDHGGHVCGIVRKMDLEKYSALITVSGDGLIHEVLNGLMSRPDWERAIRIPLGFIPAGSGNALAASIHEACGEPFKVDFVKHAALLLAKSTPVSMDVTYLENLVEERYAFLSVGWGLVADIDIESEKFRALGESRFTVQALQRVLDAQVYYGGHEFVAIESYDYATFAANFLNSSASSVKLSLSKRWLSATVENTVPLR